MADDEELNLDDNGAGEAPAKKGGSGFLPNLLKWVAIGLAAIILIVVVCVITVKIINKGTTNNTFNPLSVTEEYTGTREIFDWYKSLGMFQVFTVDDVPATVRVDVYLGYKKDDKECSAEITNRMVDIKQFLRLYFRSKTAAELSNPANEEKFMIEIKNGINDKVLSSSKIRAVSFNQLDVVEQK